MLGYSDEIKTKYFYNKETMDDWFSSLLVRVKVLDIKFSIHQTDVNKNRFLVIYSES